MSGNNNKNNNNTITITITNITNSSTWIFNLVVGILLIILLPNEQTQYNRRQLVFAQVQHVATSSLSSPSPLPDNINGKGNGNINDNDNGNGVGKGGSNGPGNRLTDTAGLTDANDFILSKPLPLLLDKREINDFHLPLDLYFFKTNSKNAAPYDTDSNDINSGTDVFNPEDNSEQATQSSALLYQDGKRQYLTGSQAQRSTETPLKSIKLKDNNDDDDNDYDADADDDDDDGDEHKHEVIVVKSGSDILDMKTPFNDDTDDTDDADIDIILESQDSTESDLKNYNNNNNKDNAHVINIEYGNMDEYENDNDNEDKVNSMENERNWEKSHRNEKAIFYEKDNNNQAQITDEQTQQSKCNGNCNRGREKEEEQKDKDDKEKKRNNINDNENENEIENANENENDRRPININLSDKIENYDADADANVNIDDDDIFPDDKRQDDNNNGVNRIEEFDWNELFDENDDDEGSAEYEKFKTMHQVKQRIEQQQQLQKQQEQEQQQQQHIKIKEHLKQQQFQQQQQQEQQQQQGRQPQNNNNEQQLQKLVSLNAKKMQQWKLEENVKSNKNNKNNYYDGDVDVDDNGDGDSDGDSHGDDDEGDGDNAYGKTDNNNNNNNNIIINNNSVDDFFAVNAAVNFNATKTIPFAVLYKVNPKAIITDITTATTTTTTTQQTSNTDGNSYVDVIISRKVKRHKDDDAARFYHITNGYVDNADNAKGVNVQQKTTAFEKQKAMKRNNHRNGHRAHKKRYKDYLRYRFVDVVDLATKAPKASGVTAATTITNTFNNVSLEQTKQNVMVKSNSSPLKYEQHSDERQGVQPSGDINVPPIFTVQSNRTNYLSKPMTRKPFYEGQINYYAQTHDEEINGKMMPHNAKYNKYIDKNINVEWLKNFTPMLRNGAVKASKNHDSIDRPDPHSSHKYKRYFQHTSPRKDIRPFHHHLHHHHNHHRRNNKPRDSRNFKRTYHHHHHYRQRNNDDDHYEQLPNEYHARSHYTERQRLNKHYSKYPAYQHKMDLLVTSTSATLLPLIKEHKGVIISELGHQITDAKDLKHYYAKWPHLIHVQYQKHSDPYSDNNDYDLDDGNDTENLDELEEMEDGDGDREKSDDNISQIDDDNDDDNDDYLPPYIKKYKRRNQQLLNLLEGTLAPMQPSISRPLPSMLMNDPWKWSKSKLQPRLRDSSSISIDDNYQKEKRKRYQNYRYLSSSGSASAAQYDVFNQQRHNYNNDTETNFNRNKATQTTPTTTIIRMNSSTNNNNNNKAPQSYKTRLEQNINKYIDDIQENRLPEEDISISMENDENIALNDKYAVTGNKSDVGINSSSSSSSDSSSKTVTDTNNINLNVVNSDKANNEIVNDDDITDGGSDVDNKNGNESIGISKNTFADGSDDNVNDDIGADDNDDDDDDEYVDDGNIWQREIATKSKKGNLQKTRASSSAPITTTTMGTIEQTSIVYNGYKKKAAYRKLPSYHNIPVNQYHSRSMHFAPSSGSELKTTSITTYPKTNSNFIKSTYPEAIIVNGYNKHNKNSNNNKNNNNNNYQITNNWAQRENRENHENMSPAAFTNNIWQQRTFTTQTPVVNNNNDGVMAMSISKNVQNNKNNHSNNHKSKNGNNQINQNQHPSAVSNSFEYHRVVGVSSPRLLGVGNITGSKQRLPFVAITDRRLETFKKSPMERQKYYQQQNLYPLP